MTPREEMLDLTKQGLTMIEEMEAQDAESEQQ